MYLLEQELYSCHQPILKDNVLFSGYTRLNKFALFPIPHPQDVIGSGGRWSVETLAYIQSLMLKQNVSLGHTSQMIQGLFCSMVLVPSCMGYGTPVRIAFLPAWRHQMCLNKIWKIGWKTCNYTFKNNFNYIFFLKFRSISAQSVAHDMFILIICSWNFTTLSFPPSIAHLLFLINRSVGEGLRDRNIPVIYCLKIRTEYQLRWGHVISNVLWTNM